MQVRDRAAEFLPWSPHSLLQPGLVRYGPGGSLGPRLQRNLQLIYLLRGHARVWVDGAGMSIYPGHCALLFPMHRERFRFLKSGETIHGWCEVVRPVFDHRANHLLQSLEGRVYATPPAVPTLVELALRLRDDFRWSATSELRHLCMAAFLEFFRGAGLADPTGLAIDPGSLPSAVVDALTVMHQEFGAVGGVAQLADRVGVSAQHLSRLFRASFGEAPSTYLWRLRTERAVQLIESTGLTLSEVANQAGFKSVFHLSRRVKAHCGRSPRELRSKPGALGSPIREAPEPKRSLDQASGV